MYHVTLDYYGVIYGDSITSTGDDDICDTITIKNMILFCEKVETITGHVSTNGMISFKGPMTNIGLGDTIEVVLDSTYYVISPYWFDADLGGFVPGGGNEVYVRVMSDGDESQLAHFKGQLTDGNGKYNDFYPSMGYVSTWYRLGYYNDLVDQLNSFQAVFLYDNISRDAVMIYNYEEMDHEDEGAIGYKWGEELYENVCSKDAASISCILTGSSPGYPAGRYVMDFSVFDDCAVECFGVLANDSSVVCSGYGECTFYDTCECESTHTGPNCEFAYCFGKTNQDEDVCNYRGSCSEYNKCLCNGYYYGDQCETPLCCTGNQSESCLWRCPSGSWGDKCEKFYCFGITNNATNVCNGNGVCSASNNCTCFDGYYEETCSLWKCHGVQKDQSDVCGGHGLCLTPNNCSCESGYNENNCTSWECYGVQNDNTSVCSSHGVCSAPNNCSSCQENYYGLDCSFYECHGYKMESNLTCSSHGVCSAPNNCSCQSNYTGEDCRYWNCFQFNNTDDNACNKHGVCESLNSCSCFDGYYDEECNSWTCFTIEKNDSSVCSYLKGNCTSFNKCTCQNEYFGDQCEDWNCYEYEKDNYFTCSSHGECSSPNNCSCVEFYEGKDCANWTCGGLGRFDKDVCNSTGYYATCVDVNTCSCPKGAFLGNNSECSLCPKGFYNDVIGQDNCTKLCFPGYFCTGGAVNGKGLSLNEPWDKKCNGGFYCSGGAFNGNGSDVFDNSTKICESSYYCPSGSQNSTGQGKCSDGYYCLSGSSKSTENLCKIGHFCVNGTIYECQIGFFQNLPSKSYCRQCSPGAFSNSTASPTCFECFPGFYCDEYQSINGYGHTFSNNTDKICKERYFCEGGNDEETGNGLCSNGYLCPKGSNNSMSVPCEKGHYCVNGVEYECGISEYNDQIAQSICSKCPPGYFSDSVALINCKECLPGYFCPYFGSINGFGNTITDSTNYICPEGVYCSGGSSSIMGSGVCFDGYLCPLGSKNGNQTLCPPGHYCQNGITLKCPKGEYSDDYLYTPYCMLCPAGYYSDTIGTVSCLGNTCHGGYFCPEGSISGTGMTRGYYKDRKCLEGYYCSPGAQNETGNGVCKTGYYCPVGSSQEDELECPLGFYCVNGKKFPCTIGEYQNETGTEQCKLCTPGFYNDELGVIDCYKLCSPGYCCTEGSIDSHGRTKNVNLACTCEEGYYCPSGSKDSKGNGFCDPGHYCPEKSQNSTSIPCPRGNYCVLGKRNLCLRGTYNPFTQKNNCLQCSPGYFQSEEGQVQCNEKCYSGFYCPEGSYSLSGRTENDKSDKLCKEAYYCPEGSINETGAGRCYDNYFCPEGSRFPDENTCPRGYYCLKGLKQICPAGFYCSKGKMPKKCSIETFCPNGTSNNNGVFGYVSWSAGSSLFGLIIIIGIVICAVVLCGCWTRKRKKVRASLAKNMKNPPPDCTSEGSYCAFGFTDIQSSTSLWERFPNDMKTALHLHNDILRSLVLSKGLYEVKTIGDAFFVACKSPKDLLLWALEAQEALLNAEWPESFKTADDVKEEYYNDKLAYNGIRVRIGLHYGMKFRPVECPGGIDYHGTTINQTARIESKTEGGQICISKDFKLQLEEEEGLLESNESIEVPKDNDNIDSQKKIYYREGKKVILKGLSGIHQLYSIFNSKLINREKLIFENSLKNNEDNIVILNHDDENEINNKGKGKLRKVTSTERFLSAEKEYTFENADYNQNIHIKKEEENLKEK